MTPTRVLRSWPWTIALAVVLGGMVLLGLSGVALRTSVAEFVASLLVTGVAAAAFARVLSLGVRLTPSGLIVRDLTRTTPILWTRVRAVECAKSTGRGYVPVLLLVPSGADGRRGAERRFEVTVLAAYSEPVARRRADTLTAAFTAATARPRRR